MGKADDRLAQLRALAQQLKAPPERWQKLLLPPRQAAALRKLQLTLSPEQVAAALRKRQAEWPDGRKLDHALAIQASRLLKPARKAKRKPKRKPRMKPQQIRLRPVLRKLWKNGVPPEDLPDGVVVKQVQDAFDEHYKGRYPTPGRLTILRAVGRLKD